MASHKLPINKGKIVGIGKISMNSSISIEDVLLINDLKHSLLSIHQLFVGSSGLEIIKNWGVELIINVP